MTLSKILKAKSPACECSMLFGILSDEMKFVGITITCKKHQDLIEDDVLLFKNDTAIIEHVEALKSCGYTIVRILETIEV